MKRSIGSGRVNLAQKFGNAAVLGAGATCGANLVNNAIRLELQLNGKKFSSYLKKIGPVQYSETSDAVSDWIFEICS